MRQVHVPPIGIELCRSICYHGVMEVPVSETLRQGLCRLLLCVTRHLDDGLGGVECSVISREFLPLFLVFCGLQPIFRLFKSPD